MNVRNFRLPHLLVALILTYLAAMDQVAECGKLCWVWQIPRWNFSRRMGV